MVSILKSWAHSYSSPVEEIETPQPLTKDEEEECLRDYKKALNAIPGLNVSHDSDYLMRFLRTKSFKIPDAVKLYKSTDGWKEKHADILSIPFSKCIPVYNDKILTVLKEKDELGRTMFLANGKNWNLGEIALETIFKCLVDLIEETQTIVENQINGVVLLLNIEGVSMATAVEAVTRFSMKNIKFLIGISQGALKVKAIHAICTPLVVVTTYTGCKYLLKKKMRNRIHVHYEGPSVLHNIIGKDRLPKSLEGNIPEGLEEDTELMKSLFRKNNLIYSP